MNLDVQTLLVVMMINMIALSIAIPTIMGWRVSVAARLAQGALLAQTAGWVCLVVSSNFVGQWLDRVLSTLAMVGLGTGMALLWQSMHGWLGERRGGRLVWGIALAMPVVYGLGFQRYPFRVGWATAGLALQMAVVCVAL
ncbi:MAG: GGDEF domain-containing protein, partial [Burkholderiales bacterium PBB5]